MACGDAKEGWENQIWVYQQNGQYCSTKTITSHTYLSLMHTVTFYIMETLTPFYSTYWLVRERQYMHMLIHRWLEGMPYKSVPSLAMPDFRVTQSRPFQNSGVNFAGPMQLKGAENSKVWLCLYTCCTTRVVHLEIVPDLNVSTFLCCFRRFTSRRGVPKKMVIRQS